jgi:hypothetical protein
MKSLLISLLLTVAVFADITPAAFDHTAIRDAATLETKIIQDWQQVAKI